MQSLEMMFIIMNNHNISYMQLHQFFHETKKSVQTTNVLCNHKRRYTTHTVTLNLLMQQITQCIQPKLQSQETLYINIQLH